MSPIELLELCSLSYSVSATKKVVELLDIRKK